MKKYTIKNGYIAAKNATEMAIDTDLAPAGLLAYKATKAIAIGVLIFGTIFGILFILGSNGAFR